MRETSGGADELVEPGTRGNLRRYVVITVALATLGGTLFAQALAQHPGTTPFAPKASVVSPLPARPNPVIPTTDGPCQLAGGSFPYGGPSCIGPGARLNTAYPVLWYDHCGLWPWTPFDGRTFYVSAFDPNQSAAGLAGKYSNFIPGSMMLTSPHTATFVDLATGRVVAFQDTLPGRPGVQYPFELQIYPGWKSVDAAFAGRLWTSGPIPSSISTLANGNPQSIVGTITLRDVRHAVFTSRDGAALSFSIANPMCA